MEKYIPEENAIHLKQFRYTGGTSSITYQHIWSPFAQFLLKFVPSWVAPNLITLTALFILLIAHIVCVSPDEKYIASWKLIIAAIAIFLYQQLDNMDGKQARRTKSSSPLGMIFDHGTDAFAAFLVGLQAMKMMHVSYTFQLVMVPVFFMTQYFCAMWSQYCIGCFKLGRINPVDQGLPLYCIMFLTGAFIDLSVMDEYHWVGTYGEEFVYSLLFFLVPQLIYMCKDIYSQSKLPKSEITFMTLLFFCSAGSVLLTIWMIPNVSSEVFFLYYYAIMFMWCRNMILIQVQFITKQKYRVFNRGTNSFLILSAIYILFHNSLLVSDEAFFGFMCLVEGVIFAEFIYKVFKEGSEILGIYVFSLQKRTIKKQ